MEDRICLESELLDEIEETYCTEPNLHKSLLMRMMETFGLSQPNNFEESLALYHILVDQTLNS